MADRNPYQSPTSANGVGETVENKASPKFNRLLAALSIGISCFALLASYGYPGWMSKFWYFRILPSLGLTACIISGIGLGRRSLPGKRISLMPLLMTFVWLALFTVSIYGLSMISIVFLWNFIPRILFAIISGVVAFVLTTKIHGTSDRNAMVVANSLAVFQSVSSIADMMSLLASATY